VEIVDDNRRAARPTSLRRAQATQRAIGVRSTPVVEFITPGLAGAQAPTVAAFTGDGDSVGGAERTRNGLLKRVPRNRAVRREQAAADEPGGSAQVDRSPAEVRSRLTSLRAGVQRGQNVRARSAGEAHPVLDHRTDGEKGTHDG
jgi:hypothetical protein